jgi:hypothetical protein
MMLTFMDEITAQDTLKEAAYQLQSHFIREEGNTYEIEDLRQALDRWLELSVESLVEDILFHTVEGDRAYAFNRRAFELQMERVQPIKANQNAQDESESSDRQFAA